MTDDPMKVRRRIYFLAEQGVNAFETLPPDDAAEYAQMKLERIVQYLDGLDDADRSARIFKLAGIEVGQDGKPIIRDCDV